MDGYRELIIERRTFHLVRRKTHWDIITTLNYLKSCLRSIKSRNFLTMSPCREDRRGQWIRKRQVDWLKTKDAMVRGAAYPGALPRQ